MKLEHEKRVAMSNGEHPEPPATGAQDWLEAQRTTAAAYEDLAELQADSVDAELSRAAAQGAREHAAYWEVAQSLHSPDNTDKK